MTPGESTAGRVCFAVQAHADATHCEKLVRVLLAGGDAVILHVDRKFPAVRDELARRLSDVHGELYMVPADQAVSVYWSGFSIVETTLLCMRVFLSLPETCQWFSLHSGQDYPVRPLASYRSLLQRQQVPLLMESGDVGPYWWRCQVYNFFRDQKHARANWFRLLDRTMRELQKPWVRRNRSIRFRMGSAWFAARRDAVSALVDASTPSWQTLWRHTACPDEHYFQTLATELGLRMETRPVRFVDFPPRASSPRTLTLDDLATIRDSGAYFARKFDSALSASLVGALPLATEQVCSPAALREAREVTSQPGTRPAGLMQ